MMILPWQDVDTLRLQNAVTALDRIVNQDLVCALPDLSLAIKLKATSKGVDLVVVAARSVTAAALYLIHAMIVEVFPFWLHRIDVELQAVHAQLCYFSIGIEVQST